MRILHISSAVDFGGGEKHIVDLCRGLVTRGHEVYLALRPTNRWQSRIDYLSEDRIIHVSIRNSFGVFSAKRIGDFVRANEIDIIHAHVARDYIPASIASIASKRAKFILTRHVMFPLKPFNRFALKNLSRAIGVSPAVCDHLSTLFPKEKVASIPNGIEMPALDNIGRSEMRRNFREFHGIPEDVLLVGSVGQLIPLKGERDLVLAAFEIVKQFPETRFVIVGIDGSIGQSYRRELKRLARVLEIDDKILWLDWVDDLSELFAALDLYVSPSHSESFGIATLEAMAAGLPVVATRTDGSRELLQRDDLVPFGDPVKLAGRMAHLLKNADERNLLASRLQKRAYDNFSIDKMVAAIEKLYLEVVTTKSSS
jgi:glycosyltransferase involved in cell wall biosynthesis